MADLFELTELADYLQQGPLDEASATVARRKASGWLRSATKLTAWPDPVPDDLWGWAIELAALAYDNPAMLASEQVGATSRTADRGRLAAILDAARAAYLDPATAGGGPLHSFPEPDWQWQGGIVTRR
ncbi:MULTISPECIES: hypothetical protein [Catenuloplanes]|uniref:Uncharacterized protein n=1 Tax=Catenuloplanes niger TaxID=587534 RepID=A0AAE3ZR02_9ACTN|nr:hypothetical protein [Catenuloplanes niger]MDR7323379.1 hypothetical protein [Catenuloplanes niger]